MQIEVAKTGSVTVMDIEGRIDSGTASGLSQALSEAIEKGATRLVIDLEGVDYVSSAGLRELVTALKKVNQDDGDLRLASPSDRVREVLELSGLDSILSVYDTRGDAVGSF
jgi:anti-sigma B factor antagonist